MRARRFAQALGQNAKTDAVDAWLLATMAGAMGLRRVERPSAAQRDLEELTGARDALVKDRTAALNRGRHARHKLLRRQSRYRLAQIERQIKALDAEIQRVVNADEALSRASRPGFPDAVENAPTACLKVCNFPLARSEQFSIAIDSTRQVGVTAPS